MTRNNCHIRFPFEIMNHLNPLFREYQLPIKLFWKNAIIVLLVIFSVTAFGQNHFIGLKGGMSWTKIIMDKSLVDNKFRTGFSSGLTYSYRFLDNVTLGIDLLYAQKGFKNEIVFTNQHGNLIGTKGFVEFNYNYLSFPIKVGYIIGNTIEGFINLGIVPSFLMNAETKIPTPDDNYTIDNTDEVTKFDFAGIIEIGGNYKINDRFLLFASFDYQGSFTTITNNDYFPKSKLKHHGMTLSLGLKYALRKQ